MSVKKYCYCENNCKYETLDKEEILAAIAQAVETGTVGECDTGFITTIKTINGQPLKFFVGEQSEYEALTEEQKTNLFAIITNDTTKEGLLKTISDLQEKYNGLDNGGLQNYAYIGHRTEENGRLLRGSAEKHLNIDELLNNHCGSYAISWKDISNGYVDGLPSFEVEGGYAANLDVIGDYNGIGAITTVYQELMLRALAKVGDHTMLRFSRYNTGEKWTNWLRYVSAGELETGAITVKSADHATSADSATILKVESSYHTIPMGGNGLSIPLAAGVYSILGNTRYTTYLLMIGEDTTKDYRSTMAKPQGEKYGYYKYSNGNIYYCFYAEGEGEQIETAYTHSFTIVRLA